MLGGEKTSQQDRASYSLKTNPTFENGLRDNLTYFCFCFFFVFFFFFSLSTPLLHSLEPPGWLFFRLYSKLVSVHLALILLSQAWIYTLCLYSSPQMMEINSHKRSGPLWQAEPPAQGSSGPFERQTKAKDFCPLCLLLKSHWKSAHAFSNLRHSSFIDALFFFGGIGGGGVVDKGMCLLGGVCGTGMVSVPWIKAPHPPRFLLLLLASPAIQNRRLDELLEATC